MLKLQEALGLKNVPSSGVFPSRYSILQQGRSVRFTIELFLQSTRIPKIETEAPPTISFPILIPPLVIRFYINHLAIWLHHITRNNNIRKGLSQWLL
jgi:hypothetical protein